MFATTGLFDVVGNRSVSKLAICEEDSVWPDVLLDSGLWCPKEVTGSLLAVEGFKASTLVAMVEQAVESLI